MRPLPRHGPTGAAGAAPRGGREPRPLIARWMVALAAAVLGAVLASVAAARLSGWPAQDPPAPVLRERLLVFADTPEGDVLVRDAGAGSLLARMQGEQGFLRGVLRGLARERRARGVGPQAPLVLSLHADARLLLSDPSTGQRIDLASFGPDNAAVFTRWLPPAAGTPSTAGALR